MEDFEEDWSVLRRRAPDRITVTMNVGEALTRLSSAIWKFLYLEGDEDRGHFSAIIQHQPQDKSSKLNFRVLITGFKDKENIALFEGVNKSPFFKELEEALEYTFREVRKVLLKFNETRAAVVQKEREELMSSQETLMSLERNLAEMGLFDLNQAPLPFPDGQSAPS